MYVKGFQNLEGEVITFVYTDLPPLTDQFDKCIYKLKL